MDRRRLLALSGALTVGALAGCTGEFAPRSEAGRGGPPSDGTGGGMPRADPDVDEEALEELVSGTNAFTFDLHDRLRAEAPNENRFASATSVSIALAMAYAGARGNTRTEMAETLRYSLEEADLHDAFAALQHRLNERGQNVESDEGNSGGYDESDDPVPFRLDFVNAAWGQAGYPFEPDYLEVLDDHYGGGLREVDYRGDPAAARREINDWVATRTEDRIDDLLPEGSLSELTRLVLTNAVYFLANWEHPFEASATTTEPFTAIDGSTHDVPMMNQERSWRYASIDGAQAVDLPYVGGEASMLVILPPEGDFESYEESFDAGEFSRLLEGLEEREGTVRLPRFEFESGMALKPILRDLGTIDAFDEREADFGGMADLEETGENLVIDDVYHDTFVAVDEEGTEAAAATGVVIRADSAPMDPFEFVADRPFLFAIRDRPTGVVVFFGRVVDPAGWA